MFRHVNVAIRTNKETKEKYMDLATQMKYKYKATVQ